MTGCDAHPGAGADIGEELRTLVLGALDKVDPVLERLREEPATTGAGTCAVCPVCAVVAALRGERPELAARLAEHASGLVAVLRAALEEGGPAPGAAAPPEPAPSRRVQRIHVDRQASC
ncbi:hypothetical protein [Pseudonocardia kunmingensis]|uniref:Uncharacterized protein n=1 Tax=Pseudonocardia kunmingensis TaxID=630975 RepID=A0A543DXQ8_9PSEU|nr:hypothetical protein [Pseudonocardia kunmingensis]TQM14115.1 hypothetical protein FB558_0873 [Pseudonocardia kunmingensis]